MFVVSASMTAVTPEGCICSQRLESVSNFSLKRMQDSLVQNMNDSPKLQCQHVCFIVYFRLQ